MQILNLTLKEKTFYRIALRRTKQCTQQRMIQQATPDLSNNIRHCAKQMSQCHS